MGAERNVNVHTYMHAYIIVHYIALKLGAVLQTKDRPLPEGSSVESFSSLSLSC